MRREGMSLRAWLALGVIAIFGALWLGGVIALRIRRLLESNASSQRSRRGLRGEKQAEAFLTRCGYRMLARQVAGKYEAIVDGEAQTVTLSADLFVERDGSTWIVEVKTGPNAPRFEHADTRRQLLEYQLAFGGDAVLLVDPERETIREVRFPIAHPLQKTREGNALGFWFGLACLALLAWRVASAH